MASRRIQVEIVGDASSLSRAFGKASSSSSKFGRALGTTAKFAGLAIGAAGIGGLAVVLKSGIAEFAEASKVAAQTGAVLKSTGSAANVTAKEVSGLADALMRKSGVDDEAIQSGENMLLTFTRIRNQVGKGNDIFNQATKATLDLSVAMGKDMPASAILVGKALNDPIKGMSALSKAGIQFTQAQKDSIKAMVEAGNTMGAQKMILKELETQFGGSAAALGKTLPGQIEILKQSFSNLSGEVVAKLVPTFTRLVEWATKNLPAAFAAISAAAEKAWPKVKKAAQDVIAWYQAELLPALKAILAAMLKFWDKFGADVLRVVRADLAVIRAAINTALALISGDWNKAWKNLLPTVRGTFAAILALTTLQARIFNAAAKAIGMAIVNGLKGGLANLGQAVTAKFQQLLAWIRTLPGRALAAGVAIGRALTDGVVQGIGDIGGRIYNAASGGLMSAVGRLKSLARIKSPSGLMADEIGTPLAQGIASGLLNGLAVLKAQVAPALAAIAKKAEAARARMEAAFSGMGDKVMRAFDATRGGISTPAEAALKAISDRRETDDLNRALADAMAGGDPEAIARAQEDIQVAALQRQADIERTALDQQTEAMREKLEAKLAAMSTVWKGGTKDILKLLQGFGVDFGTVGSLLGGAFRQSLIASINGASRAAGGSGGVAAGAGAKAAGAGIPVVQVILDGKVLAESNRKQDAIYTRANGVVAV